LSVIKIYISRLKKVFPNSNYYDSYLEYENIEDFKQWILAIKPKDVRNEGISERGLRNFKQKIKNGRGLKNKSKIARILFEYYKSKSIL